MDDPEPVRLGDGLRQHLDEPGRPSGRPGGAVEPLAQAAPLDVLQLEVGEPVGLADVVDLHDVGVLQAGNGLRLGQEAGGGQVAGMGPGQDHLEGAGPVQSDLSGVVNHAHAAAPEFAQDLVAVDRWDGPHPGNRRRFAGRLRDGQDGRGVVRPGNRQAPHGYRVELTPARGRRVRRSR